jgi:hypothetical protein
MKSSYYFSKMNFNAMRRHIEDTFLYDPQFVHTPQWQGMDISKRPEAKMVELINVTMHVPMSGRVTIEQWAKDVKPNLPWADDHFHERVCGYPINPGVEWANWPWGDHAERFLNENGIFNHNYMERYWPRYAGTVTPLLTKEQAAVSEVPEDTPHRGIRHQYGDLMDMVDLLASDPFTRQAYIPIFFPEDTGIGDGGRKPCTLGYQFMVREGVGGPQMHVYYPMRSCDFYSHWADDVYLTLRLAYWVIERAAARNPYFEQVRLGSYTMHCTSLHMFINHLHKLRESRK